MNIPPAQKIRDRLVEIEGALGRPDAASDPNAYRELAREHRRTSDLVRDLEALEEADRQIDGNRRMLGEDGIDPEFAELVRADIDELERSREALLDTVRRGLVPPDPNDERNIIVEIRAGAGGEEAALFAGDLTRMYQRFADRSGWKAEILSASPSELGGFKEIIFAVQGQGVYRRLRFESGVHRVQRVPVTETGGRIHTSTATVAVLPEAEKVDIDIPDRDLRIDVYRSSGPGGQSVNTTDSAVRVMHLPTGLIVQCQDEKSQLRNKEKALRVLRARLLEHQQEQEQARTAADRRSQIGTGDRSERIRTYNFPQNRVTDHRIGLSLHGLPDILDGAIGELVDALAQRHLEQQLDALA